MEIYKFYKKEEFTLPSIYAITNKKEYADKFMSERNMDLFELIVSDVPKKFVKNIIDKYKVYELGMNGFYTKENMDSNHCIVIHVLSTLFEVERSVILSDSIMNEISKTLFNAKVFKIDYLQALVDLKFIDFYTFYKCGYNTSFDYFYSGMEIPKYYKEDIDLKPKFDELGLFIKLFGYTLKDEKISDD